MLSANTSSEGNKAGLTDTKKGKIFGWQLKEVCEKKQEAFKSHTIPGTIEAEDFDLGCPGDAYYDENEINEGGEYRSKTGVDIEKSSLGGYNVGWTHAGEWMEYTVSIKKPATYQISFYLASTSENGKFHLECDGKNKTGAISVPNTAGYQNWDSVRKQVKLDAGEHVLKLVIDNEGFNLDKMVFE